MAPSSEFMDETIDSYLASHTTKPSEIELRLIDETQTMTAGDMQIGQPQAQFMTMLTALPQPKLVIEIGTFTGYSTLVMAKALSEDAKEDQEVDTVALREFNNHVMADRRVQVAMLPIGDGLSMISLAGAQVSDL